MRARYVLLAPLFFAAFLAFLALGGLVVQLLWNWLLPPLFGVPAVTFWQALGVLALSRILFGGFGSSRGGRRWHRGGHVRGRFRDRMRQRWHDLSAEDRDRVRTRMRERFGFDPEPPESRDL
jgi:hypothetical protein